MGLFSKNKPKIKVQTTKKDGFNGWLKCPHCQELIHMSGLEKNLNCCPVCEHHYRLSSEVRIKSLVDTDTFKELYTDIRPSDPLKFKDSETYSSRIKRYEKQSSSTEAVRAGVCTVEGYPVALAVMDFSYMGGSMGSVVGERLTRLIEHATFERLPVVIVSSSGGARMQESIFSLMQMAKTSAALARLADEGLPFISILTNPTMGGVTASFATLGDVILAEPDAVIGFAGPRVIEQSIGEKLPEGAQKPPFHLENGMIDAIVPRKKLRKKLAYFIEFLTGNRRSMRFKIRRTFSQRDTDQAFSLQIQELMRISDFS